MRTPLQRIRLGAILLGLILAASVIGYRWMGRTWLDATYMVVITVATVGYGEHSELPPAEQALTIAVILFGISAWVYTIGGLIQLMTQGEIAKVLGARRMTQEIRDLHRHVIVCGFGRMGQILAGELHHHKRPFVVIDNHPERVMLAGTFGYLVYNGDAAEEDVLQSVGILRAQTLVTVLPNDAANVFITLTSRNLNRGLQIIARGELQSTHKKLVQAGADRVVLPASIGAMRIASMVTRPATVDLLELVSGPKTMDIEVEELKILESCSLVTKTLEQTVGLRRHGLLTVALGRAEGSLTFNPPPAQAFAVGDTLIVMGRPDDLVRFRKEYSV